MCQVPIGEEIRFLSETDGLVNHSLNFENVSGGTIAIGSGCMKSWEHIATDLDEFRVVNHSFGGARTWELIHYAQKLVINFNPSVVIFYCGSADIS